MQQHPPSRPTHQRSFGRDLSNIHYETASLANDKPLHKGKQGPVLQMLSQHAKNRKLAAFSLERNNTGLNQSLGHHMDKENMSTLNLPKQVKSSRLNLHSKMGGRNTSHNLTHATHATHAPSVIPSTTVCVSKPAQLSSVSSLLEKKNENTLPEILSQRETIASN